MLRVGGLGGGFRDVGLGLISGFGLMVVRSPNMFLFLLTSAVWAWVSAVVQARAQWVPSWLRGGAQVAAGPACRLGQLGQSAGSLPFLRRLILEDDPCVRVPLQGSCRADVRPLVEVDPHLMQKTPLL